jgi:hypothetical protein
MHRARTEAQKAKRQERIEGRRVLEEHVHESLAAFASANAGGVEPIGVRGAEP